VRLPPIPIHGRERAGFGLALVRGAKAQHVRPFLGRDDAAVALAQMPTRDRRLLPTTVALLKQGVIP
jgi:hypothetical protein